MTVLQPTSGSDETKHEIWQAYIVFEKDSYMEVIMSNAGSGADKRERGGRRETALERLKR